MTLKLQRVGFYSDLPHGEATEPRLVDSVGKLVADDIEKIVRYLSAGIPLVVVPGLARDILSESSGFAITLGVLTDGEWAWPTDLSYYVATYTVGLPAAFVAHIRAHNYRINEVELHQLEL